jgi:hypothetical protein
LKRRKFNWYEHVTRMIAGLLSEHRFRYELTALGEKEAYEKAKCIS